MNKLILGDCFEVMKGLPAESVDLIYLDPPFFSNKNYEVIWGDEGEIRSFRDRWAGGIEHYIDWLKERVEEMHRILKKTGSFYLHCDWHANAEIKTLVLNKLFGRKNFKNEIIWCYKKWSGGQNQLSKNHDCIYYYSKSDEYIYNQLYGKRAESTLKRFGNKRIISGEKDEKGKRIPSVVAEDDSVGVRLGDWWEIPIIAPSGHERINYPTQKPEALLERIIKISSNEGDVILDPFVGGGTTVAVADRLKRNWIGIDQSVQAIKVSEIRLDKQQDAYCEPFLVQLHKYDYDTLRYKDAFEFETWIINQFSGTAQNKKGGDKGIDGKMKDNTPIQVKRSDKIGRNVVDNFLSAIKRLDKKNYEKNIKGKKPVGYIIAFSFGSGAKEEVARLKNQENIIIKLVEVKDIVSMSDKPSLSFECKVIDQVGGNWEVEFIANSESPVEFYSWDFNYDEKLGFKADVIRDPDGNVRHKFGVGAYNIAVKVVDNEGLENIETKKIKSKWKYCDKIEIG